MAPSTNSQYQTLAFLALLALNGGLWIVFGIGAAIGHLAARPNVVPGVVVGCLHLLSTTSFIVMMAVVAGFHQLPMGVCVMLALLYACVASPMPTICFSAGRAVLFRRSVVRAADADGGGGDEQYQPTDLRKVEPTPPSSDGDDGRADRAAEANAAAAADGAVVDEERWWCERFRSALFVARFPQLAVVVGFYAFCILITHLAFANACYCSSPSIITTWMSRSTQKVLCPADEVCHMYGIVGSHCSMPLVVAHFVAASGDTQPTSALLEWTGPALPGASSGRIVTQNAHPALGQSSQQIDGRLVTDRPVAEDWRTVAQFAPFGLACGQNYTMTVTFFRHADRLASKTVAIHTLPLGAQEDIVLVGGGDFGGDDVAHDFLWGLHQRAPNADIVYIGGDVSYSDNGRYCYRRWDENLVALTRLVRPDGSQPLLKVNAGNHEAGGYLNSDEDTRESRRKAYVHFTTYFPSPDFLSDFALYPQPLLVNVTSPHPALFTSTASQLPSGTLPLRRYRSTARWRGDDTITFYRSFIGTTAWIALDSDTMLTSISQVELLNETLYHWAVLRDTGAISKIVATYHCPGLPTARDTTNAQAEAVRRDFYPLLLQYNVSLALENHDHVYKRSHRLASVNTDGSGTTAAPGSYNGILLVGDGSLGVADSTRSVNARWYHNVTANLNQGYVARLSPSGHFDFAVYTNDRLIDNFTA